MAATKSFVASARRAAAIDARPGPMTARCMQRSIGCQIGWRRQLNSIGASALDALAAATSLVTIGRGPTLAIAREAALKLKETCNLHAEPFSGRGIPARPRGAGVVLAIPFCCSCRPMRRRQACRSWRPTCGAKARRFSRPTMAGTQEGWLPALEPDHPDADAVCLIQSFYALAVRIAQAARHRCGPAPSSAEGDPDPMSTPSSTRSQPIMFSTARSCSETPPSSSRVPAIAASAADQDFPRRSLSANSARRRLACARLHRHAGQWRRRCAVQ